MASSYKEAIGKAKTIMIENLLKQSTGTENDIPVNKLKIIS